MRAAAAGALFCLLGALALPAAAGHDEWTSVPEETEQVCRPLPSGPPAPTCDGGNERGVILVGGSVPSEGSVRICHNNEYRSVCDDFFTHRGAGVACRQLGYATGVPTYRSHFVGNAGPVSYWLDDVDCRSTEANLGDCPHPGWGLHNCGANERAGVMCMTRVTGLRATAGKRQVSLAWDEPRSRYDGGFTGHEYRYKTLSEDGYGPWQAIPDSAATEANVASYTVTGLFEGTWYSFQVRILGGGNASDPGTAGVRTAGEANRLPEFAGPQKRSVAENSAAGAAVGAPVTASDADGETLRYSLEAVGDHASFTIEPSSGQIRTRAVHDREARNRYSVTVKADDGEGGIGTVAVTIEIADVEEQPTDAEIVTGPGSDGVWSAGERVEARVRFGVPVRVALPAGGRAPELLLAFYGGDGRVGSFGRAAYTGGSGTETLSFAYTVTEADAGAGSVVVPRNALRSGDASIEHASGGRARARAGVSRPSPAAEGGTMAFRVSLARAAAYPVTVDYATADGTATEGEDYEAVGDTLTFAPGETEKTVEVPLLADTAAEGDETLTLRLSNARSSPPQELSVDLSPDEAEGTIADGPGAAEAAQAVSPLTASLEGMPEAHDGSNVFHFRVAFSEDIGISFRSLREDAFAVTGGRVTQGRRVDGRRDLFEITVEPDSNEAVTISLPAGRECGVSGAICTKGENRRQLTNTPTATVAGPEAGSGPAPLTARFVGMPAEHRGEGGFRFRVAFSEDIGISFRSLREDALTVTGGRVTGGKRVDGRRDLFEMTVRPDSVADVTITLPAGRECAVSGAICTKGENRRGLSYAISALVPGPAALTVADARAREGEDETIDFAVTLSRAASATVTVDYGTADGTAAAGSDYTASTGTLTFRPGETAKAVSVALLDDAHDEGEETLTFRLSNASGARIADGVATGTIENSDLLPQAWLARFGRTAAGHVVDAIGERVGGDRAGGTLLMLGGQRVGLDGGRAATRGDKGFLPDSDAADGRLGGEDAVSRAWTLTGRELLLGSSFRLALGEEGGIADGTRWTAWGRAAATRFDGDADGLSLDGDVTTVTLGADAAWSRWLAGVAVARSTGKGGVRDHDARAGHPDRGTGRLESTLTSVHPYARVDVSERLSLWGVLGYGTGEVMLAMDANGESWTADTTLRMAAAGARSVLVPATESGGLELAARTDALLMRITSEAVSGGDAGNLAASEADTSRLRLILEGSRSFAVGSGTLTPSLEAGLRHDGGDAETGTGVELGGGLRYADPESGLTVEGSVRTLVAHEASGYEEWGASGSVRLDPGASGRGLSLTLRPAWGAASGGAERLWGFRDARSFAENEELDAQGRLDTEIAYGFGAFGGRGLATPYAGFGLSQDGDRTWRAGARWSLGPVLAMSLDGTRREPVNDDAPEHGLKLGASLGW